MATIINERSFKEAVVGEMLDASIDWIQGNLNPEDVFKESQLEDWAERNGFVKQD